MPSWRQSLHDCGRDTENPCQPSNDTLLVVAKLTVSAAVCPCQNPSDGLLNMTCSAPDLVSQCPVHWECSIGSY